MNKRRERTLQDLCHATPTLSRPEVTPVLTGSCRMQGPADEANSDLLTDTVTSQVNKSINSSIDRSQKIHCEGRSGACNVCSAPCSSCFHASKVLMDSTDESAGETCAENVLVDRGKQNEIGPLSEMSTVAGMTSNSDCFSENAVGKASSRTSDASASDDYVVHSKCGNRRVEGLGDSLSCVSITDENPNRKSDIEDGRMKYSRQSRFSGASSEKVPLSSSPTGLSSQDAGFSEVPPLKSIDTDLLKDHHNFSQASHGKSLPHDPNSDDIKYDKPSDAKGEGSSEPLVSSLTKEAASDVVCGVPPVTGQKSIERNDDMEVEIQPTCDTDDSDMVEHDVKVCDICGDAGREELLAICSRCSDGAEHTYCMRKMLDKVPEGDWLCEECKSIQPSRTERQERSGRVDEYEKNNYSGQASSEYVNSSDIDGQRTKSYMKNTGKRLRDDADAEVSSIAKKPALEAIVGSPKTSVPSKTPALSRENSFKNLDKGKPQPPVRSSDTVQVNDNTEPADTATDPRVQNFRGTFSKSSSFSSLSSKPKVKLVDQVILQRQKSARDHSSFRLKAGVDRSIGKSLSFKSTNSGHSESKIKTLSPRLSHIPDIRNSKQQNSLERQSSFKTAHPSNNSVLGSVSSTSRNDKKIASKGESSSLSTITNHPEVKPVQTVGKSAALLRSSSLAARRNSDSSRSVGEFKRPSLHHTAHRVSSANTVNNGEQKPNQLNSTEDSSSCSVAERPPNNANEGLPDGLSRPRDLAISGERMRESSGSRFRPPSTRISIDESNNLKAAIEAAVLKKPGLYGKHRALDPTLSSIGSHSEHISDSYEKKNLSLSAYPPQRQAVPRYLHSDSLKQDSLDNVKQFSVGGDSDPIVPLETKPSVGDMFSNVPTAMPFCSRSLAIPDHEYIWQGCFEICRSGKVIELWDGIQAHLSTCASPKVIETGSKFKSRIVLCEVPRLSAWPVQFEEHGVKEDNIALFFFAKDLESYGKTYKVLLDNMMKNDLALRGNVNGIELLIYPSNQLPDNAQRWNMLFFLWGVFRGKKESCLPPMPDPVKQFCAPGEIPSAVMSFPETKCSLRPIATDLPASDDTAPVSKAPEELCSLLSSRAVNENYDSKVSILNHLDIKSNFGSTLAVQSDSGKEWQEPEGIILAMRSTGGEEMPMQLDTPRDRQQLSHHSINSAAAAHDMAPEEGIGKSTVLNRMPFNQDKMNIREDSGNVLASGSIPLEEGRYTRDLNIDYSEWLLNNKELVQPESCVAPRTLYPGTSQVLAGSNDTGDEPCRAYEKLNHAGTGSRVLKNQLLESSAGSDVLKYNENGEMHFFPIKPQPVKGVSLVDGSTIPFEQVGLHDEVPNLELGLGAETNLFIEPLLVEKLDKKIDNGHILETAGTEAKDDVSASLSLSLAFPFPEKEQRAEVVSEKECAAKSSFLLFGCLRDS